MAVPMSSSARRDLPARVLAASQQTFDVDELGHGDARAEAPAKTAEDIAVGDILHGREDDGALPQHLGSGNGVVRHGGHLLAERRRGAIFPLAERLSSAPKAAMAAVVRSATSR